MTDASISLTLAIAAMWTGFIAWCVIVAVGCFHALSAIEAALRPWVRRF